MSNGLRAAAEDRLAQGADRLGLTLTQNQSTALIDYLELLTKWNKAYNLTAIRDMDAMVRLHLLDSLALIPYLAITKGSVLDVGAGAGLPSIPLSLVLPDLHFRLLDSNGKKTRFMTQVSIELGLKNCAVVQARAESYQPPQPCDIVVARAFASLQNFHQVTAHLAGSQTRWLAMKGRYPQEELAELGGDVAVADVIKLQVPFIDEDRYLVIMEQNSRRP